MKEKLRILKKLIVFIIILVCLDYLVGSILKKYYFLQQNSDDSRTTFVINDVTSDILILGSSRATYHYDTPMIEDSLKMSAYNGGRIASQVFYYYGMVQSVLKRYHPKLIVLDIIPYEFEPSSDSYERLSCLLPYYDGHPELREICELRGRFEKYKLLSKIYPYNSKLFFSLKTMFNVKQKTADESKIKGYYPVEKVFKVTKKYVTPSNEIDSLKLSYFKKILADCKQANVKLVVCVSPIFIQYASTPKSIAITKQLCELNKVPFYDYSTSKIFDDEKYYSDYHHLNRLGATLYTRMVLSHLK